MSLLNWIMVALAGGVWCFGIYAAVVLCVLGQFKYDRGEAIGRAIFLLLACGIIGAFIIPSGPVKDITYSYIQPTLILKTNGITIVSYIDKKNNVYTISKNDGAWWISTNILVEFKSGENLIGKNSEEFDIVKERR